MLDSECRRHRVRICPIKWRHWTHHGGRPQRRCVLLSLWEVKSGEGNSISSEVLLIYRVLISPGIEKAHAFSHAPPSLTHLQKPIFLSSRLMLGTKLNITLRCVTFFLSCAKSYAIIRPPSQSWLLWESPFLTCLGCQPSLTTGHSCRAYKCLIANRMAVQQEYGDETERPYWGQKCIKKKQRWSKCRIREMKMAATGLNVKFL